MMDGYFARDYGSTGEVCIFSVFIFSPDGLGNLLFVLFVFFLVLLPFLFVFKKTH